LKRSTKKVAGIVFLICLVSRVLAVPWKCQRVVLVTLLCLGGYRVFLFAVGGLLTEGSIFSSQRSLVARTLAAVLDFGVLLLVIGQTFALLVLAVFSSKALFLGEEYSDTLHVLGWSF
jgi:hypothetical protein